MATNDLIAATERALVTNGHVPHRRFLAEVAPVLVAFAEQHAAELATRVAELEKALRHYADEKNWDVKNNPSNYFVTLPTIKYRGHVTSGPAVAQAALKESSKE